MIEFAVLDFHIDLRSLLRMVVAAASFVIAAAVFIRHRHIPSVRYFSLTTLMAGLWVFFGAMIQVVPTLEQAFWWSYITTVTTPLITLFFILFSIHLGREHARLSRKKKVLIYTPPLVLFFFTLIPGFFYESVSVSPVTGVVVIDFNTYYRLFFTPYIAVLLLASFPILFRTYVRASDELKLKLRYVIFGAGISVGTGILGNLVLPLVGVSNLIWLGSATVIVFVITVSYALTRRQLWDFKLAITEAVLLAMTVILIPDIFITIDPNRALFKIATLILLILFGFFLIREVSKEVGARRKLEQLTSNLTDANSRLKAIDVERSEFISIVSHQLRTPLTVVKGYASMALEGSFGIITNKKHLEIITKVFEASQRLVVMIEEFLNISKIEKGEMTYSFSLINLSQLAEDVVQELRNALSSENISMHFEQKTTGKMNVIADALKIRQVITNLLDNAIKYNPRRKPIHVELSRSGGRLLLGVHDQGIGIPQEVMPRLFKKYSRAVGKDKLHTEGRGLGLYIAQQIIHAHGGRIWVESPGENKGTTVFVELPEISSGMHRTEIKNFVKEVA